MRRRQIVSTTEQKRMQREKKAIFMRKKSYATAWAIEFAEKSECHEMLVKIDKLCCFG